MKIRVLGSGAGGGFPQWNCNCPNCDGLRKGTLKGRARTQSSIAVSIDGESWLLFNASPDILAQIHAFPALQPARAPRDTAIVGVVLVDSQIDHTTGLLMLREGKTLDVYCTPAVREDLTTGNPLFHVLSHYCGVRWKPVTVPGHGRFSVPALPRLGFVAVPLPGKAPPYSPHRENSQPGDNIGIFISDTRTGRRLFYAPGIERIDADLDPMLAECDCVMLDGTFWRDDEMIHLGISDKRARDLGHLPQSGEDGMIAALARFPRPRKILIHINNTNPILDEASAERAELTRAGIEVAYDGMEVEL